MAFGGFLKQSTAVDILIGPFLDEDDGKTAEESLTLSQADIKLSKNGQALAQKADNTAAAHDSDGYYNCELDTEDTAEVGQLTVIVHESGALPVRHEYQIIEEIIYDEIYAADAIGVVAMIKAMTGFTAGGTWTYQELVKCLAAYLLGTWQDKSGDATTQEILDAEDDATVILEIKAVMTSPYKATTKQ